MKKKIVTVAVLILCILGFSACSKEEKEDLVKGEISNIKEVSYEPSRFSVEFTGLYDKVFSNADLKDGEIKIYEFDAVTDNNEVLTKNTYIGVLVKDVLKYLEIEEYENIYFKAPGLSSGYDKEGITDKLYLVFAKDGKEILKNTPISMIDVEHQTRYWMYNVMEMAFM